MASWTAPGTMTAHLVHKDSEEEASNNGLSARRRGHALLPPAGWTPSTFCPTGRCFSPEGAGTCRWAVRAAWVEVQLAGPAHGGMLGGAFANGSPAHQACSAKYV